jgi:hypothetical protein
MSYEISFSLNKGDSCPAGTYCEGFVEYRIDYCTDASGVWERVNSADCPCSCRDGFSESVFFEGPAPFADPPNSFNYRIVDCVFRGQVGNGVCFSENVLASDVADELGVSEDLSCGELFSNWGVGCVPVGS